MTLHQTIEISKKFFLGIGIGLGAIIVIVLLFQLGIIIKNIIFPAQTQPPTQPYGQLPPLEFGQNASITKFSYTLNTVTGALPEFPDRLNVYPVEVPEPNFLNLNKAKEKAKKLNFINQGTVVPERKIDNVTYSWNDSGELNRKLIFNIITFDFILESNYLSSPPVLGAHNIRNETDAVSKAKILLEDIALLPNDIDFAKTLTPANDTPYVTRPQLLSITNGTLVSTTSLSKTQVIRVDLYQKNLIYKLNTGVPEVTGGTKKVDIELPILYPRPPYSTMNFWIASNDFDTQVVAANFFHKTIARDENTDPTYPIKTANEAFEQLKNGKGYIAAYHGDKTTVTLTNIYLAYFLGEETQEFLMPIIVFEGNNGFFAYVSAAKDELLKK